jgi:hypothetical protein
MASQRVAREIIEADFEIAFSLIDLAPVNPSDLGWEAHALSDAEDVVHDIERRIELEEPNDRRPFGPLLGELKRQLARAKCRVG